VSEEGTFSSANIQVEGKESFRRHLITPEKSGGSGGEDYNAGCTF
jgi:hypothetical protein